MNLKRRTLTILLACGLGATAIAGCGSSEESTEDETEVETAETQEETEEEAADEDVENEAVDPEEVGVAVGDVEFLTPEIYYYYLAYRVQTEMYYDYDWTAEIEDGVTYGEYLKDLVESQVLQNMFWISMADDMGITLSDDDNEEVLESTTTFLETFTEDELEFYGFTEDNVTLTMEHITLAAKVLDAAVEDEIDQFTEEEVEQCTFRTVQHILFLTESEDDVDEDSSIDAETYNAQQLELAEEVLEMAENGEDFETLADEYTEDSGFEYSLNVYGESPDGATYVDEFTEGAWALSEGEMAIVETDYGYHIIKCVTENDEDLYEEAAEELALDKYDEVYEDWLEENEPEFCENWQNFVVTNDDIVTVYDEEDTDETEESAE